METRKKCKKTNKYVIAITKEININDGNSLPLIGNRTLIIDCKNKDCKYYRGCKICKFEHLY